MARKLTGNMKALIAICAVYFSGQCMILILRCFCSGYGGGGGGAQWLTADTSSAKHESLQGFGKARAPVSEVYVISLHESKFNVFEQRNFDIMDEDEDDDDNNSNKQESGAGSASLEWFPAYNGMNQTVLDEFSKITGLGVLNATYFQTVSEQVRKSAYASPHAVGCYLSHWRLLEKAHKSWGKPKPPPQSQSQSPPEASSAKRKRKRRPDMLFVLEDDAHCVTNLIDRTWKVVQKLPKDWDILYIGGKPFSYFTQGKTLHELTTGKATEELPRPTDKELLEQMCQGGFGKSYSGPYAPGTTRDDSIAAVTGANLPEDPPYWRTKWVLNTNAYVINPKRIQRVLRVLSEPKYDYKPIDVTLAYETYREFFNPASYNANSTDSGTAPLKAFLTPHMYCDQEIKRLIFNRDEPPSWEGYYWLPWQTLTGFPNAKAYVWGKLADRNTCPGLVQTADKK